MFYHKDACGITVLDRITRTSEARKWSANCDASNYDPEHGISWLAVGAPRLPGTDAADSSIAAQSAGFSG
jgi:hypothetical protein